LKILELCSSEKIISQRLNLYDFVRSLLLNDWMPFYLQTSGGSKLTEEERTLAELGLCPAVVVHFLWDESVMNDVKAAQGGALEMQCI
jgi:hypothetical protein